MIEIDDDAVSSPDDYPTKGATEAKIDSLEGVITQSITRDLPKPTKSKEKTLSERRADEVVEKARKALIELGCPSDVNF